jgi:hypothetical protein
MADELTDAAWTIVSSTASREEAHELIDLAFDIMDELGDELMAERAPWLARRLVRAGRRAEP